MNRFLTLVGVAVVAAAMYVAASPASQQSTGVTKKQFVALQKKVAAQGKTLKAVATVLAACDQHAVAIGQFGNPPDEGYHYQLPGPTEIITTALDVADPSIPGIAFFAYGDSSCGTQLGTLRHAALKAGMQLPKMSSSSASFRPH